MFIVSAKVTKQKLIGAIVTAGIILAAVIFLLTGNGSAQSTAVSTKLKTNDDRLAYLAELGWDVSSEPIETQEVLIPNEWDDAFISYNEMLRSQSFDLTKYKGKRVTRYTYTLSNYPDEQKNIVINLLSYKNTIIGGDIQAQTANGFIRGLCSKQSIVQNSSNCSSNCPCDNCVHSCPDCPHN